MCVCRVHVRITVAFLEGGELTAYLLTGSCAASKTIMIFCWLDALILKELKIQASYDDLCACFTVVSEAIRRRVKGPTED